MHSVAGCVSMNSHASGASRGSDIEAGATGPGIGTAMRTLDSAVIDAAAAKNSFSGVVSVHRGSEEVFARAYGSAHRALGAPNTLDTRFAIASGSKIFTAIATLKAVEVGALRLNQPVREVLRDDLPLIDDAVTIEQLIAHTSGIGDYLDEDADWDVADYVLAAPVHTLDTAAAFLPLVDGFPQRSTPGAGFSYCNGAYIVLAIVLERVMGGTFHDILRRLVFAPAALPHTDFLRLDELPGSAAVGYLFDAGDRVNTLHLPVLGNGDGGAFTTAGDLHRFWRALFEGRLVTPDVVAEMTRPRYDVPDEDMMSGLGVFLSPDGEAAIIEGYDAGVSFRSTHIPASATTASVLGNSSEGAWPVIGAMAEAIS